MRVHRPQRSFRIVTKVVAEPKNAGVTQYFGRKYSKGQRIGIEAC